MHDAPYFREQAQLYFELARRMSVPSDAEYFRGTAERCLTSAREMERRPQRSAAPQQTEPRRHTNGSPFGRT